MSTAPSSMTNSDDPSSPWLKITSPGANSLSSRRIVSAFKSSSVSDSNSGIFDNISCLVMKQKSTSPSRFVQALRVRAEQIAAREDADDARWIAALDHRQTAHFLAHHVIGGLAQRHVRKDDGGRTANEIADARERLAIDEIAPRHPAEETAIAVEAGKTLVRRHEYVHLAAALI